MRRPKRQQEKLQENKEVKESLVTALENRVKGLEQELKSTKIFLEAKRQEIEMLKQELDSAQRTANLVVTSYNSIEEIATQLSLTNNILADTLNKVARGQFPESEIDLCAKIIAEQSENLDKP